MNFTVKDIIPAAAAVVIFGGIAIVLLLQPANKKITSFDECALAGFPVIESTPRVCRAGGVTFTKSAPTNTESFPTNTNSAPTDTESISTNSTEEGTSSSKISSEQDMIHVFSPVTGSVVNNSLIVSPVAGSKVNNSLIVVKGEARGPWYFEGSFPVLLLDGKGKEIARGSAQAQGDWMTDAFVPFSLELAYVRPETELGWLVLKNDNPSGLPENDKSIKIRVRFMFIDL